MRITEIRKRYGGATMNAKAFGAILKVALTAVGKHWWTELFPKHFKRGAQHEYRYQPRAYSTIATKRRQGVEPPMPLVTKRGALRELTNRPAVIKTFGQKVTVRFVVPPGTSRQYRDEMTRFSARDRKKIVKVLDAAVQRGIDAYKGTTTEVMS